jgi:hypothetical protein
MKDYEIMSRIDAATSEHEITDLINRLGRDWTSAIGLRATRKIEALRHADMKPPAWYKHPATWIAIASVIVAILGWIFPRH